MEALQQETITRAYKSCPYFLKHIYKDSYVGNEKYIHGTHIDKWGAMLQEGNACIISARKHSKSETMYGYLQWIHTQHLEEDFEIMYIEF